MSQDVVRWLNEVKDLQQQLQKARESEEAAHASANNWRKRYEIEAEQRRTEASLMQQTIEELRGEIEQLKTVPQASSEVVVSTSSIEQAVHALQTVPELQAKLIDVWTERDRLAQESYQLAQDLKTEQAAHTQTRKSLTMALGDTVDMLTKLKNLE